MVFATTITPTFLSFSLSFSSLTLEKVAGNFRFLCPEKLILLKKRKKEGEINNTGLVLKRKKERKRMNVFPTKIRVLEKEEMPGDWQQQQEEQQKRSSFFPSYLSSFI